MSKSISETGHAVNISNSKLLIDACTGFGESYNPSNEDITIANLTTLWTTADASNKALSKAEADMKEPINQRALLFKPLNLLITRVMGAVDSSKANDLLKQDAKGLADRIRGANKRNDEAPAAGAAAEPIDKVSTSHQSFVQRAKAFLDLVNLLGTVKEYKPNETDLQVKSLAALQKQMEDANDGIGVILDTGGKAKLARNRALYKTAQGLVDMAQVCRDYVKSVFGTKAAEYKQVTKIKFRDLPKEEKDKL